MSTYLVRLAGNKELVGLFWADNLYELADAIDEAVDVDVIEIRRVNSGGIFWPMKVTTQLPIKQEADGFDGEELCNLEKELLALPEPEISERFFFALYQEKGWRKLFVPSITDSLKERS